MQQTSPLKSIIDGNIESLEQGQNLIDSISTEAYQQGASPIANSSIGEHFRHILDMYFALMSGFGKGVVDFNTRRRGAEIEKNPKAAIDQIRQIKQWLLQLDVDCDQELLLNTEVALHNTRSVEIESYLARELVFASSHAVHHYAVVSIIAKLQGLEVDNALGIAAATATNLRDSRMLAAASG